MTPLRMALALALGSAVSLGLARFSYALLLPPMRADLGWSYFVSGAMNTVNAAGYLAGALLTSRWLRRHAARRVLIGGSIGAGIALMAHGLVVSDTALYALRFVTGVSSAATFIAGGLLAARVAGSVPHRSGLVLGIYYGGTGIGIVASAVLVPFATAFRAQHGWQAAWVALGAAALLATAIAAWGTRTLDATSGAAHAGVGRSPLPLRPFARGLASYFLFGLGYIGYMTFVISLLRETGLGASTITIFYAVLGVAVCASSWLWARLLQRQRGGRAMALLDALLAVATLLPVVSRNPVAVFASGVLFGSVFLSVVASTTALVRHNAEHADWPRGIAAFTIVFAAGQIVGPALIGWLSDRIGGLEGGFAVSAGVLAAAALIAWGQRPLATPTAALRQ